MINTGYLLTLIRKVIDDKPPSASLYGAPDNLTPLNTTEKDLVNFPDSAVLNDFPTDLVDAVNGEITIPKTAVYRLTVAFVGAQGNAIKEEQMGLGVKTNGANATIVDVFDIATDKTIGRSVNCSFISAFDEGDVVSCYLVATADLGTFTFTVGTFSLEQVPS